MITKTWRTDKQLGKHWIQDLRHQIKNTRNRKGADGWQPHGWHLEFAQHHFLLGVMIGDCSKECQLVLECSI